MSSERAAPAWPEIIRSLSKRLGGLKLLAAGGATVFALTLAVGAGAAPSPIDPVAEVLGLGGEHGAAVSDAVQDARADATEAGDPIGPAVSEAACTAAHDRSTLPPGAQNAPGQQDREPKDCTSDDEEDVGEDLEEDAAELDEVETEDANEASSHGAAVSQAVHDAKANLEDGEKVGPAVSEAACTAAHDRSTLPEGAQNAPGQEGREPKDCTHPSNADDDDEEPEAASDVAGESKGHGKQSAPGQLKKQLD